MKKRIVIFGSTGSIGTQTLDVVRNFLDEFEIVGLAAGRNTKLLKEQIEEFGVKEYFSLDDSFRTQSSLLDLVQNLEFDLLVGGASGIDSLESFLYCFEKKIPVALANKEVVVSFGEKIQEVCGGAPATLSEPLVLPVDSEHSGLFQCLRGEDVSAVKRVIITASGGALRDLSDQEKEKVTSEQVLSHPTWKMGKKVTVDSATLMNKAFEVIEAHFLFGIPYEKIEVRLHRESKVHAIVEFNDGHSKLVVSEPDMRLPIQYALFFPKRVEINASLFNYDKDLSFQKLEEGRYPCFDFALEIAKRHPRRLGSLVQKDEETVEEFLDGKIRFTEMLSNLKKCL
jgi:1-deoxy-D-xylulose-5-phosphate reductoisomerase